MIVEQLVNLFAPWQSLYSDSKVLPAITESTHLLALLFGGGLAVGADRATLRAVRRGDTERSAQLVELSAVHRPVLMALAVLFVSGVALAAADIKTFVESPAFWVKLGLVALLLANGGVLQLTESSLRRATSSNTVSSVLDGGAHVAKLWKRLKLSSVLSLLLWSATLVAGAVLVNLA